MKLTIEEIILNYPIIISFICGLLAFLLGRQNDITILIKSEQQRTETENYQVEHGLKRSFFLELLLLVPSSIILFWLCVFPFMEMKIISVAGKATAYALMGLVGYGFPLVTIKKVITQMALKTLEEYFQIAYKPEQKEVE